MGITTTVNYNFALDLFEKRKVPPTYTSVDNKRTGEPYTNKAITPVKSLLSDITEVKCIPEFLTPLPHFNQNRIKTLKIKRIQGFYIDLSNCSSVADYLNEHLSSKQRARLRSQLKRLENCFDITYEVYYGQIEKEHYDNLFDTMELFIKKRFDQRGEPFDPTVDLAAIKERCYSMINNKMASFHVIYNGNVPIDICLNYHFQDVVNHSIRSYDIDYAKFGLGNSDIIKQLDWCLQNNFRVFDFMWGDLPYKHFWSNKIYLYEHHMFYNPKSVTDRLIVATKTRLYRLKDRLNSKRAKAKNKGIFHSKDHVQKTNFKEIAKIEEINYKHATNALKEFNCSKINIDLRPHSWLRPFVYNFQHRHVEHSKNISVHQLIDKPATYIVIGNKNALKIVNQDH